MRLHYYLPDGSLALTVDIPPAVCPQLGWRVTLAPATGPPQTYHVSEIEQVLQTGQHPVMAPPQYRVWLRQVGVSEAKKEEHD